MKILYLNSDLGIPVLGAKGASVHVREFVTAAASLGHEVTVVCASLGEGNASPPARMIELSVTADNAELPSDSHSSADDRIRRREMRWLAHDRTLAERTLSAIEAMGFQPDVIYERHALFHAAGVALARRLRVPRILEVNAPLIEEQRRYRGLVLAEEAEEAQKISYEGADRIVAVSDEVANHVISTGVPREHVLIVPNGVDTAIFVPGAGSGEIRRRIGDGPVIGFIGSFKPWHGTDFLLRAFGNIVRRVPTTTLLCIGEGPALERFRQDILARGLQNRVITTGCVPHTDIPAYLAAMDMTVAPYMPDKAFYFSPLKVMESMSAGVPVVAAHIGQLAKIVDDGRTGVLYTPGDQSGFVATVLALLRDPLRRRMMGEAARARAVAQFDWHRVVETIIATAQTLRERRAA